MNQEQFKESWDQLKGALKKQWGTLTEEDLRQIGGDQEKFNGAIQKRYGEMGCGAGRASVNEAACSTERSPSGRTGGMRGGAGGMKGTKRRNPRPDWLTRLSSRSSR